MGKPKLSEEVDWSTSFYYDETSPSCLCHSRDKFTGKNNTRIVAYKGTPAGGIQNGYYTIRYNNKFYQAHRVVYELCVGKIPEGLVIDHVNQNKLDNNISNLRLVTTAENNKNKSKSSNNKTGTNRLRIMYKDGLPYCWAVDWIENGRTFHKSFSIRKYGNKQAYEKALNVCLDVEQKLTASGYTNIHGKEINDSI